LCTAQVSVDVAAAHNEVSGSSCSGCAGVDSSWVLVWVLLKASLMYRKRHRQAAMIKQQQTLL
jgi:hypothetical protein